MRDCVDKRLVCVGVLPSLSLHDLVTTGSHYNRPTMTDQHPSSAYAIERTVVGGGDRVVGTTGCCDISLLSCAEC